MVIAAQSAQGWKDDRLAKAYGLVSEVADSLSSESAAWPSVKAALEAIESADCDLEAGE